MAFAVDLVIANVFFTLTSLLHAIAPSSTRSDDTTVGAIPREDLPHLLVLVPLYQEIPEAVERTFTSLRTQTYPSDKIHVRCIVEKDDESTKDMVETHSDLLSQVDFQIVTNTKGGMKAGAMNYALSIEQTETEYVVVYDGDDKFEKSQLLKLTETAEENRYDAVMPRVYRVGDNTMAKLLALDTHMWNAKMLPFLHRYFGVFPQSGEGNFLRRNTLEQIGGFPHSLTEDAMLAIEIAERDGTFGLVDSRVYEHAPTSLRGHFTQRFRWNRGYYTCLRRTLSADLSWKKKIGFTFPFIAPVTSAFTLPAWILFIIFWITLFSGGIDYVAPWMTSSIYRPFLYWSAFLGYIGNVLIGYSYMQTIAGTDFERYAPYTFLLPIFWIFLSLTAIGSAFKGTKQWGRTDRNR